MEMTKMTDWLKVAPGSVLGLRAGMSDEQVQAAMGEGRGVELADDLRRWDYTWDGKGALLGDAMCVTRAGALAEILIELTAHERPAIAEAFNAIAEALDSLADTEGPKGEWTAGKRSQKFVPRHREWNLEGAWKLSMGHDVLDEGMPIRLTLKLTF